MKKLNILFIIFVGIGIITTGISMLVEHSFAIASTGVIISMLSIIGYSLNGGK